MGAAPVVSAGSGSAKTKRQEALDLEAMLVKAFGPDFREKAIVSAIGSFRLAEAFDECGLVDPKVPPATAAGSYGLWQIAPMPPAPKAIADPFANAQAARRLFLDKALRPWSPPS